MIDNGRWKFMEHFDILFTNMSHFERINFTTDITVTGTYILKFPITQCQETIFVRKIKNFWKGSCDNKNFLSE